MKKWIFIFVMMIFPFCSFAEEEHRMSGDDCGEHCSWKIEDGVLTIKGYGEMYNYVRNDNFTTSAPWGWQQYKVNKVVIQNESDTNKFTSIGNYAFCDMLSISEFVLPEGIEKIGALSFNTSGVQKINLPDSLKEIGTQAFGWNSNLKDIELPEGLEKIAYRAFVNTGITTLTVPQSVEDLDAQFLGSFSSEDYERTPLIKLYCASELEATCENATAYRKGLADVQTYEKKGGLYEVGGVSYRGINQLQKGVPVKRIYTVDEANQASGKKNSVMIRYK